LPENLRHRCKCRQRADFSSLVVPKPAALIAINRIGKALPALDAINLHLNLHRIIRSPHDAASAPTLLPFRGNEAERTARLGQATARKSLGQQ
jgi:hypothetical protein